MTSVTSLGSVSATIPFEITSLSTESVWVTLLHPVRSPSLSIFPLPLSLTPGDASKSCLFTLQADVHTHILTSRSIYWLAQSLHSVNGPQTTSLLVKLHSNNYALIPIDLCLAAEIASTDTNVAHLPIVAETDLTLILSTEPPRNAIIPQDFSMDPPTLEPNLLDLFELLDPLLFLQNRYYDAMYSLGTPLLYFAKLALARFRVLCESNGISCVSVLEHLYLPLNKLDERHLGVSGVIGFPSTASASANDVPDQSVTGGLGGQKGSSDFGAAPVLAGGGTTALSAIDEMRATHMNVDESENSQVDAALHISEEHPFLSEFKNTHRHVLNYMAQYTTSPDFAESADPKVLAAHSAKLRSLVLELKIREAQLQLLISIELVGSWGVDEQQFLDFGAKLQAKEAQRTFRRMATSLVRRKKSKKHSVVPTFLGMGVSVADQTDKNVITKELRIGQHEVFTSINAIIDRLALWDTLLVSTATRTESQLFAFFALVIVPYYSKRFPVLTRYIVNEYKLLSVKVVTEKDVEKDARRAKRLLRRDSAPLEQAPILHRALTEIDAADDPTPTLKRSKSNLSSRSMTRREVDMALTQKSLQDAKVALATPAETPQPPTNIFRTSRKRKDMDSLKQPQVEATPAKPRPKALANPHEVEQTPRAARTLSMPNQMNHLLHETPYVVQTPRRKPVVPATPFARRRLSFENSTSKIDMSSAAPKEGSAAYASHAPINSPFWTVMSTPLSARHYDTPIKGKGHAAQLMNSPDAPVLGVNTLGDGTDLSRSSSRRPEPPLIRQMDDLIIFSSPVRGSKISPCQKVNSDIDLILEEEPNGPQDGELIDSKIVESHDETATKSSLKPLAGRNIKRDVSNRAEKVPLKRKPRPEAASSTKPKSNASQSGRQSKSEATEMVTVPTVEDSVSIGALESADSVSPQAHTNYGDIPLARVDGSNSDLGSDSDFGMLTLTSKYTAAPRTYSKRGIRKGLPR